MEPTAEERDLIRQGERTVDNLKRLFAVIFAASFGLVGAATTEKVRAVIDGTAPFPSLATILVNLEMTFVFAATAGVFYHQSAKFLDIRYARHPLSKAHPLGFALDYGTLVLTAAPFFFMAQALSPAVTHKVGYFVFFGAYVVLFTLGLCLLGVQNIRHSRFVRVNIWGEDIPLEEIEREGKHRQFWLLMNSGMLLMLLLVFALAQGQAACPPAPRQDEAIWFLYAFGAIAILRYALDYGFSWRFVFPLSKEENSRPHPWPLSVVIAARWPILWSVLGYALVALCIAVAWYLDIWNIPRWIEICSHS
jgi:magnesium-transporting ATPase (P-type)